MAASGKSRSEDHSKIDLVHGPSHPSSPFPGPVEADETRVGGREAGRKLRAGRGPAGKAVVAGIRDRETDQVVGDTGARTPEGLCRGFHG